MPYHLLIVITSCVCVFFLKFNAIGWDKTFTILIIRYSVFCLPYIIYVCLKCFRCAFICQSHSYIQLEYRVPRTEQCTHILALNDGNKFKLQTS